MTKCDLSKQHSRKRWTYQTFHQTVKPQDLPLSISEKPKWLVPPSLFWHIDAFTLMKIFLRYFIIFCASSSASLSYRNTILLLEVRTNRNILEPCFCYSQIIWRKCYELSMLVENRLTLGVNNITKNHTP